MARMTIIINRSTKHFILCNCFQKRGDCSLQDLFEQYHIVLAEIEKEKGITLQEKNSVTTSVMAGDEEKDRNVETKSDAAMSHNITLFALYCLKVKIYLQFSLSNKKDFRNRLNEDLNSLIKYVEQIENKDEVSDEILDHLRDVLLLIFPEYKDLLHPFFLLHYKKKFRRINRIDNDLYFLVIRTSEAYEQLGYHDMSVTLLEGLCQLSRDRNEKERHQELLTRVFGLLIETSVEAAIRIARINLKYFENSHNEYSGEFFWGYGCALEKNENISEAAIFFEKCYLIRRVVYGENHWYTALAKREYSLMLFISSEGKYGKKGLFEFVDHIEQKKYPYISDEEIKTLEGKTLYILLFNQSDMYDMEIYNHYLTIYEEICDAFNDVGIPLIQRRLAKNLRGCYWMKMGDYIQAESCILEAINTNLAKDVSEILTIPQIKTNLLAIYYAQNDIEMALPLLSELLDALEFDEKLTGLSEKDEYRIYTLLVSIEAQCMIEPCQEEMDNIKSFLQDSCKKTLKMASDLPECTKELVCFIMNAIILVLQLDVTEKNEQKLYLNTLDKINREYLLFPIDQSQRTLLNYTAAILAWHMGDSRAENYFSKTLHIADQTILPLSTRIGLLQSYAFYSTDKKKYNSAVFYIGQALMHLENMWKSCVKYLNDEKIVQMLTINQNQFTVCYSLLRRLTDVPLAYERVLQFKALASLVGKERNRILHSAHIDSTLLHKIRRLQDKIATLEAESIFRDVTDDYEKDKEELRKLEACFAHDFPMNNIFIPITWDNVQRVIPDDCTVIEYFLCRLSYNKNPFENDLKNMGIDVFITRKRNGACQLDKLTIYDGEAILSAADEFVETLQAESNCSVSADQLSKMIDVRAMLFQKLIAPILPYLDGIKTIYIAPDYSLVNLPFEILYDDEHDQLEGTYTIIKIECARDFLYRVQSDSLSKENLLIGNPQFELKEPELGVRKIDMDGRNRMIHMETHNITPLPFSQIEVERIGRRCACNCNTGYTASKKLLMSDKKFKNIHIATHGFFDFFSDSGTGMYSSCLLFAGVTNWLKDGAVSNLYGNGILTADEISRLDFKSVELVVLSSCLSGMNEASICKGFQGMIGAFSASGVHYVISHLWEANDFSSAVLMDAFYYQYIEKKQSPPVALALAKKYVKQVTIGELKIRGWFDYLNNNKNDRKAMQKLSQYQNLNNQFRPFRGESYWGGFACYQCY